MYCIPPKDGFKPNQKLSCVYMIRNIKTGKVYIGQTVNYRSRMSDYNCTEARIDHCSKRYMYRIVVDEGTENFEMSILKECDPSELLKWENYYINYYDATNPEKGYNLLTSSGNNNNETSRLNKSLSHIGLKQSIKTKQGRTNTIYAVKDDTIIISEGGKLFGDYIGKGKDIIKNGLRQPYSICGYCLYYADYNKRQEIRTKMMFKRSIRNHEYMEYLDLIDKAETEGVETNFGKYFKNVKHLSYTNVDEEGTPILF